ncbi:hypothetical protein MKW98_011114 [Papaver atlanticum]|uniref:F-box associated beta-propeller type 1 domain-containing protein n=1 Tax=Papaver atlanticum TaxID=357466 RepID=A0AAD4TFP9_9MAGN|nr:hypothetical protein MKW98_011114 [Papaver atlanticum]
MESLLPDEVIVSEILTRVSLSALLRQFQWVCRDWHNCIHESKFQLTHSQRTPTVTSGFFLVMRRSIENISDSIRFFPFNDAHSRNNPSPSLDFLPSPVRIAGSSAYGSMFCCVTLDKSRTTKSIPMFYICKPATREWRKIPNPRTRFDNFGMRIVVTQTHPTLQYKIVRISHGGVILEYHGEIFDSVTWAWKRLPDVKTSGCLVHSSGGVYINGCLHWINNMRQIYVLSIEQEKWDAVIHLPPDIECEFNFRPLLILIDGKIGVLISSIKEWTELWVLENYYSHTSWKKRYRKDLRALSSEIGGECLPIAMSSTGIIFMLGAAAP